MLPINEHESGHQEAIDSIDSRISVIITSICIRNCAG